VTPPIFIAEGGEVLVFSDVAKAEQYLEPIDVDRGRYDGWDSVGLALTLRTSPGRRLGERVVVISAQAPTRLDREGMQQRLQRALGVSLSEDRTSMLPQLVRQFVERAGFSG
jgi:hypothetical protein